jgi:hypothetical protein
MIKEENKMYKVIYKNPLKNLRKINFILIEYSCFFFILGV